MCTCPSYLKPLRQFRKRIAYANGYHTDFVVPTSTAAFLNPDSTYPHHPTRSSSMDSEGDDEPEGLSQIGSDLVVATFNTPQGDSKDLGPKVDRSNEKSPRRSLLSRGNSKQLNDELLEMSNRLDSLGWKKVIVDLREHMPVSVKIPNIVRRRSGSATLADSLDVSKSESNSPSKPSAEILESRDVASAFSKPEDVFAFPLAHNTMVAAENHSLSIVFKGGRPLMDGLAKEMIEEIFAWNLSLTTRTDDDDSF